MKMIVGLGNPGKKYEQTKHNVGFRVVDALAKEYEATFQKNPFEAQVATFFLNGEKIILVKPQTYMNDSGRAVGPLMTYLGVELTELVVVYDDLDLALGKIRLRQKGSAGGHNGMKSLISHLGSQTFNRIKKGQPFVNHVLSTVRKEEETLIEQSLDKSVNALIDYLRGQDFLATMNRFN